jgi:hypothetical protein
VIQTPNLDVGTTVVKPVPPTRPKNPTALVFLANVMVATARMAMYSMAMLENASCHRSAVSTTVTKTQSFVTNKAEECLTLR